MKKLIFLSVVFFLRTGLLQAQSGPYVGAGGNVPAVNTIAQSFITAAGIKDNVAQLRVNNSVNILQQSGFMSGTNGGLVDAWFADKTYNGSNGVTLFGRQMAVTNLLYPDSVAMQWPSNNYPFGCYFSANACAALYGLPNLSNSTIYVVGRYPWPQLNSDTRTSAEWLIGAVNTNDNSAFYYTENPSYQRAFVTGRSNSVATTDPLYYSISEAQPGVAGGFNYLDGSIRLFRPNEPWLTAITISNGWVSTWKNGMQGQVNGHYNGGANGTNNQTLGTNAPVSPLTSVFIGQDRLAGVNAAYAGTLPYLGEIFAMYIFTNVPSQAVVSNLNFAVMAANDALYTNPKKVFFLADSRWAVLSGVNGNPDARTSPAWWIEQQDLSIVNCIDLQKGSIYSDAWLSVSNVLFATPNQNVYIHNALGYNTVKGGATSNLLGIALQQRLLQACNQHGAKLIPWTIMASGTNNTEIFSILGTWTNDVNRLVYTGVFPSGTVFSGAAGNFSIGGNLTVTGTSLFNSKVSITYPALTQLTLASSILEATNSINNYLSYDVQNQSNGNNASSDLVATANTGTDTTQYVNMGINGSGFSQAGWTINGALVINLEVKRHTRHCYSIGMDRALRMRNDQYEWGSLQSVRTG